MTTGPLNPKEVAQAAIARGELHTHEGQAHNCSICGVEASMGKVKLPAEAGIAALPPAPKRPKKFGYYE